MPPPRTMSVSACYTRSSDYSDGSLSSRSHSSTEEADDNGTPESSPPPRNRNRGKQKNSPTSLSATISDHGDKTEKVVNAFLTAKATSVATLMLASATATPTQPARTHNFSCRPTRNTPATNVGSTHKTTTPNLPLAIPGKKPTAPDIETKITRVNLDVVHTLRDKLHRTQQRYEQTIENAPNKPRNGNNHT